MIGAIDKYFSTFDDRGTFCNMPIEKFKLKRVYVVKNFESGMVRAFHYHKHESKVITCIEGYIKLVLIRLGAEDSCVPKEVTEYYLKEGDGKSIIIPLNVANGWQSLQPNSSILVFSDKTAQESMKDDVRYPANLYDWEIKWR